MGAYIEVKIPGGGRAFIEAGSINGIITSAGMDAWTRASEKQPLALLIRGGETLAVVEGQVGVLLVRIAETRERYKQEGRPVVVDFLEQAKVVDDTAEP